MSLAHFLSLILFPSGTRKSLGSIVISSNAVQAAGKAGSDSLLPARTSTMPSISATAPSMRGRDTNLITAMKTIGADLASSCHNLHHRALGHRLPVSYTH